MDKTRTDRIKTAILLIALIGLAPGLVFSFLGRSDIANLVSITGAATALAALVVEIIRGMRSGEVRLDIVAALSMSAALTG